MQITKDTVVTLDFSLHDASSGELIETTSGRDPFAYLHGAGQIVPGLEEELEGREVGAHVVVEVPAEKGFGERIEQLQGDVPRAKFEDQDDLEVGMQIAIESPQGRHRARIVAIADDVITLDANHPLAGKALAFEVTVTDVRAASEAELEQLRSANSPE